MSTLKILRDLVFLDAKIESDPDFPPARIDYLINQSQRYVQSKLNRLGFKKFETTADLVLSVTTFVGMTTKSAAITQLTGYMETSPIKYINTSGMEIINGINSMVHGQAFELPDEIFRERIISSISVPTLKYPKFMRTANFLHFYPYTITSAKAFYYRSLNDLTDDNDLTEIPIEFELFIVEKTVIDILNRKGVIQDMQKAVASLDRKIADKYQETQSQ